MTCALAHALHPFLYSPRIASPLRIQTGTPANLVKRTTFQIQSPGRIAAHAAFDAEPNPSTRCGAKQRLLLSTPHTLMLSPLASNAERAAAMQFPIRVYKLTPHRVV